MHYKIACMRQLGADKSRIQALSLPEIADRVRDLVHRLGKRGDAFEVNSRRPRESHVVNAALLHFLAMSVEEQDRAYLIAKARLEALMELDGDEGEETVDRIISPAVSPVVTPSDAVASPRRKHKGAS